MEVDSLPGGLHVMSSDLFKKVGGFCEAFNPYGFEDVDFCISAKKHGYKNYLVTDLMVIHDKYMRYSSRSISVIERNRGKMKLLLTLRHLGVIEMLFAFVDHLVVYPIEIYRRERSWNVLKSYCLGITDAFKLIKESRRRKTIV